MLCHTATPPPPPLARGEEEAKVVSVVSGRRLIGEGDDGDTDDGGSGGSECPQRANRWQSINAAKERLCLAPPRAALSSPSAASGTVVVDEGDGAEAAAHLRSNSWNMGPGDSARRWQR
mmetsp:Transcript_46947/g.87521  ORF Transcript_46947/g.87521 Transcript_46947/m.87521 type:complete len:119 (-) Transcript_46947:73-429(-)